MLQPSPVSSQMPPEVTDMKLDEKLDDTESAEDSDSGGLLQFFISLAAANTPLVGPLLASATRQQGKLTAGSGLETAAVASGGGGTSGCSAVVDFTASVSPSKVSGTIRCR